MPQIKGLGHEAARLRLAFAWRFLAAGPRGFAVGALRADKSGHATSNHRKHDAGARNAARTRGTDHRRLGRAFLDDEHDRPDDNDAAWRGRRIVRHIQARGRRRLAFHDRIPGPRRPRDGGVCDEITRAHRAGGRFPGTDLLHPPPRIPLRHARGGIERGISAVVRRGGLRRRRVSPAKTGRAMPGLYRAGRRDRHLRSRA